MNYEFWLEAEKFLYDTLFKHLIILGPMFILLINMLLFVKGSKKKNIKIIFSILLILFISFGTNTLLKFNKYKILYDYTPYINYGIRNNKRIMLGYDYPGHFEKAAYKDVYLVENFRNIPLYKEELLTEDVVFLGRDGDNFYFQDMDQISYRKLGKNLEIVKDISNPIREGAKFHLIDSKFQDIGFKEKSSSIYLLSYKIPESMASKKFENPENIEVVEQKEITLGWINPTRWNKVPTYE